MKKIAVLSLALLILFSCNGKSQEEKVEESKAKSIPDIDFNIGSTPIEFSVKTTDGGTFNSKDNKGKYWVVMVYQSSDLKPLESYDMIAELNETHQKFGDKIPMVGLVEGFSDDEKALQKLFANAKLNFKQIENTEGPGNEKQLSDNVVCTPAKIIIDPNGKVIYNGCGGKTQTLNNKLDSLIKAEKL